VKYYCKNCNSEFKPGTTGLKLPPINKPEVNCPFCGKKNAEYGIMPEKPYDPIKTCIECEIRIIYERTMSEYQKDTGE
jgi:DNA-directed RNA polymerase subunit RPC12/RpoP